MLITMLVTIIIIIITYEGLLNGLWKVKVRLREKEDNDVHIWK